LYSRGITHSAFVVRAKANALAAPTSAGGCG
jgi:hypothetical protein